MHLSLMLRCTEKYGRLRTISACSINEAIQALSPLQGHQRSLLDLCCEEGSIQSLGFFSEDTNSDFNSSLTKSLYSTPRDARKGISDSNNDTWDALVKNKVSARRGLPMMRAGLKRHVKRGLWEEVALLYRENSHHLSMGPTTTMVIPFSDDAP